jgi:putative hydroxymethylpyrimidine transport system permease protein
VTTTASPPATERPAPPSVPKRRSTRKTLRRALPTIAILLFLGLVWEACSHWFGVPDYILPSLERIWTTGVDRWSDTIASATWVTTKEVVLGFLLAVVAGLSIAFVLHSSRIVRDAVYPLLIGSQAIPIVVIAPVLAIIFGYTITPKLIVVALVCVFPSVVSTLDGLAAVDPELIRVMRTLDGDRWATFRRVEAPAALPNIFSGMRIAATYAPIGAVFGEYAGSTNGLGYVMVQATPQLETDLVFVAIFFLTAESILLFVAVSVLERMTCPWARKGKR